MLKIIKKLNRNLIYVILVSILLTGCTTVGIMPPAPAVGTVMPKIVKDHVWKALNADELVSDNYATYSYVLIKRDEKNSIANQLYLKLIDEIKKSTTPSSKFSINSSQSGKLNLFLIPTDWKTKQPDYELSIKLMTVLSLSSQIKFSNFGPYIITLYEPIRLASSEEEADILYFDFTNIHIDAIADIVKIYKEKLTDDKLNGIEKLESLRISLLNFMLNTEKNIGFAKAAYADMQSSFITNNE